MVCINNDSFSYSINEMGMPMRCWYFTQMQPAVVLVSLSICTVTPGLEIITLEYSLRLKIKRNDWLFADMYKMDNSIDLDVYQSM